MEKFRLLAWLVLVLAGGFVTTSAVGYRAARDAVHQAFGGMTVPAASDLVHGEIREDIQRSLAAASLIANDAFVRNWLLGGEQTPERLIRYLQENERKFGISGSFLISERSRREYQGNDMLKTMQPGNPREAWFSHVREMKSAYEASVSSGPVSRDAALVSVSHRITDNEGNFIGAAGVGLPLNRFAEIIERYQSRFGCRIYLVDHAGIIMLGNGAMQHVRDLPSLRRVTNDILQSAAKPAQTSYREGESTVFINARFIPELEWFLVIEQRDWGIQPVQQAFLFNLAVGTLVTGLILLSVMGAINRYRGRLANVAAIDTLTGLINRPAYEFIFQQALLETNRTKEPLSLILIEVDKFKRVVELLGRSDSDQVLQNVADLAKKSVRGTDPVCRWSENQFMIQLRDCPLHNAIEVAERLRLSIAAYDFGVDDPRAIISLSLGVAKHEPQEPGNSFLDRAYEALGLAKEKGGNRVEPEPSGSL